MADKSFEQGNAGDGKWLLEAWQMRTKPEADLDSLYTNLEQAVAAGEILVQSDSGGGEEFMGKVEGGLAEGGFDLEQEQGLGGEVLRRALQQGADEAEAIRAAIEGEGGFTVEDF